jgi:hypothetical protein
MIESDLPFDSTTAQRLMKISRDPRLRKAAQGQLLPLAWRTLYELTKLPNSNFDEALAEGKINPAMPRKDAEHLVAVSRREITRRIPVVYKTNLVTGPSHNIVPIYQKPEADVIEHDADEPEGEVIEPAPQPESAAFPPTIAQAEWDIAELETAVQHGTIQVDDAIKNRIRNMAHRLLALIEEQEHEPIDYKASARIH